MTDVSSWEALACGCTFQACACGVARAYGFLAEVGFSASFLLLGAAIENGFIAICRQIKNVVQQTRL